MIEEKNIFYKCEFCNKPYMMKNEALICEKNHKKQKDFDNLKIFELKQIHLDLLKESIIDWFDCEFGAPCIDCKRPYGNSDVEDDIANILKLPKKGNWDKEEEYWNDEVKEKLFDLHKETQIALEIILHCQSFKLGKYKKIDFGEWKFIE
jgi:hypothetical protein